MNNSNYMAFYFFGSKRKGIKWLELNRWIWRGIRTLELDGNYTGGHNPWHDHGIGYVMFAQDEKCLFRGLNDEKHIKYYKEFGELIWNTLTDSLSDYQPFQGLSEEQIYQIQLTRWLLAHGLAFQVSNPPPGVWDDEKIVFTMQQGSSAILEGLKQQFASTTK